MPNQRPLGHSRNGFWKDIEPPLFMSNLFENDSITDINYPELFSLFHIDTWWGQSKYVRKFEISQRNFEKNSKFVDKEKISMNFA